MTTQLTINIEESLLQSIGQSEVERSLQEWVKYLQLRGAAKEILKDFNDFDVTNDPKWQIAREMAWQQERPKYLDK
jgi:uncharacterized coiled-coil DUF342 family protein